MAIPAISDALRAEYQRLFDTCQIRPERHAEADLVATRLLAGKARYDAVSVVTGVPAVAVGLLHQMECGGSFKGHLHNGDPLTARTVRVPAGRPKAGQPPFAWEDSAADALTFDGFAAWRDWSPATLLYCMERYNGWGYRAHHPEVLSPYLWSGSNHYRCGKYVQDGLWSATAVSKQIGAGILLRRLAETADLAAWGLPPAGAPTQPTPVPAAGPVAAPSAAAPAMLHYDPDHVQALGIVLQQSLNRLPDVYLREDGKLGPRTSDAVRQVFGWYLVGDPRG